MKIKEFYQYDNESKVQRRYEIQRNKDEGDAILTDNLKINNYRNQYYFWNSTGIIQKMWDKKKLFSII